MLGFYWGETSGTASKHILAFSGPLFPIHLETMGYPFLQVKRTAVANVGNSLIVISVSGAPVTLAPCHGLPKLLDSKCSEDILFSNHLWQLAPILCRVWRKTDRGQRSKCHETLELSAESWDKDILRPAVYVAGFRLSGISSRMAFQNWEAELWQQCCPQLLPTSPQTENCCISWAAAAVEQSTGRVDSLWNNLKYTGRIDR